MDRQSPEFPLVDALLLTPEEGKDGVVGVCTNTSAPGQVFNEVPGELRDVVSVLGPVIVSRDGVERMILNSLAHPTLRYLVLFSEESLTFAPSTNLLAALQHGFDSEKSGNYIAGGQAASAHYPNLNRRILDEFRKRITVLPLFMSRGEYAAGILEEYLAWLRPRVSPEIHALLVEASARKNIYYDVLEKLLTLLKELPAGEKERVDLDPKDFQHLQPPKVVIPDEDYRFKVPFHVRSESGRIRVDLRLGEETFFATGSDEFMLEYSIMKFLGERKSGLEPREQILLGAEIGRVNTELKNGVSFPSLADSTPFTGMTEIMLEPKVELVTDKKYYYRISVKEGQVSVMCLAFDVCDPVFELRSGRVGGIFKWLAEKDRFEPYEMDILHRMDVGGQIARAGIAAAQGYSFIQDFTSVFRVNTTDLPLSVVQGDTFLDVHKQALTSLYTAGLTEQHGDAQKGLARSGVVLAIYRDAENSLAEMPKVYKQGAETTDEMRAAYKKQLLRLDHDGDYSYGQRTRSHFGFDQLPRVAEALARDPGKAALVQRYDPRVDMGSVVDAGTGKTAYTHDPCLTHDLYFVSDGRLHSFHIARAHNVVNAYPENVFGLHDAYVTPLQEQLGLGGGDLYMLSSRANILLLTEEQRTRKLIAEPSKPSGDLDASSGPYLLGDNVTPPGRGGVAYAHLDLAEVTQRPTSAILDRLEDYEGVDTIRRAIDYHKAKGVMHNNTVMTEYCAGAGDPQGDYLAFFQANVMAGQAHATAVFMNHPLSSMESDLEVCNYLATRFATELGASMGKLSLFYVVYPSP